jgi:hypothetical protein
MIYSAKFVFKVMGLRANKDYGNLHMPELTQFFPLGDFIQMAPSQSRAPSRKDFVDPLKR